MPVVNSDRIFVSRTPEQFMDMCRGKMAVEQDRIIGPFISKWLRTQIIVDDVSIPSSSGGAIWADEQSRRIISKFDKKWDTRLHVLFKGEHLEIIGKLNM
jgi:Mg2+/Co2+ transporter CorB